MRRRRPVADVTVIGAGPAGLAAAVAAAESGAGRVLLIDQTFRAGGQIWRHRDEGALPRKARSLLGRARTAGVWFVGSSTVIDALSPNDLVVDFRGRADHLETAAVIVATGARERFLPFPGWTLPGVTGVGGLQAMLKGGLDVRGKRVVLAGTGPLLFAVAAAVAGAGARLLLVAEQAPRDRIMRFASHALRNAGRLAQALRHRVAFARTPYSVGTWISRAEGGDRVRTVTVSNGRDRRVLECDWLGAAAGMIPVTDVAALLGCAIDSGAVRVDSQQATSVPAVWAAGECTGVAGDAAACVEGEIAGRSAAGDVTGAASLTLQHARDEGRRFGALLAATFAPRDELRALADPDTVICRCEDVRLGALQPGWTQRQAKLWTRLGMGACQGAVCGPACTALFGWDGNAVRSPLGTPTCAAWMDGLHPYE